jgi:hypothetical protein
VLCLLADSRGTTVRSIDSCYCPAATYHIRSSESKQSFTAFDFFQDVTRTACTTDVGYAHGTLRDLVVSCTHVLGSNRTNVCINRIAEKWCKASEVSGS